MKRRLFTMLLVLSVLMTVVGTVSAAPKQNVSFLGGTWTGGGVIFTFSSDDFLGGGWLQAKATWDGGSANFTCVQEQGSSVITCSAPKSVADKNITVTFQGSSWKTYVKSKEFCYPVYDYDENISGDGSDFSSWYEYGPHCQGAPADPFAYEPTEIYNPYYDDTFEYWYWYENCWGESFEEFGFYYNCW